MKLRRKALPATLLNLAIALTAGGCGGNNAGLTNGPPPTESGTTAGARTDLPTPEPGDNNEILGRTGDDSSNAGIGGRGGGTEGNPGP
jgi:hypothetical protein